MQARTKAVKQFFEVPHTYLRRNFNISMRSLAIRELVGSLDGSRLLDIGCGDGRISLQYASATNTLVLIDLSEAMLKLARQNTPPLFESNIRFVNTDVHVCEDLGLFDVVLCVGVLAHVTSIEHTVTKVAALLKPGGICIFQITDADSMGGKVLNVLYKICGTIKRAHSYTLNRTTWGHLLSLAHMNNLEFVSKRQYMAPFPGMGKLPSNWLFEYQLYTLRHAHIAKFGSEIICLFHKDTLSGEDRCNEQSLAVVKEV